MNQIFVLSGAAAILGVLAKRGQRSAPFKQFEVVANNLKSASKQVDSSAAAVEVALNALSKASRAPAPFLAACTSGSWPIERGRPALEELAPRSLFETS